MKFYTTPMRIAQTETLKISVAVKDMEKQELHRLLLHLCNYLTA